eukprot:maker-scaffold_12-snap-gene-6.39-mRNA-1 protein AED:0.10 eAED:0.10 QI:7/0.83/0.71/0.85/0/0/7/1757/95
MYSSKPICVTSLTFSISYPTNFSVVVVVEATSEFLPLAANLTLYFFWCVTLSFFTSNISMKRKGLTSGGISVLGTSLHSAMEAEYQCCLSFLYLI